MSGLEPYLIHMVVASTAISSYSAYQQGQVAKQQSRAQAAWHAYNAKVAQREAEAERKAAAFESQQFERGAKQLLARQRALVGKAGVEMAGSPLLFAEDTAAQLALEAANIRTTGVRRVQQFQARSILDIGKARAARTAATAAGRAGILEAGAGLLGGAAQVGFMRSQGSPWGSF